MRFRLVENRIDDIRRMLLQDIDKKLAALSGQLQQANTNNNYTAPILTNSTNSPTSATAGPITTSIHAWLWQFYLSAGATEYDYADFEKEASKSLYRVNFCKDMAELHVSAERIRTSYSKGKVINSVSSTTDLNKILQRLAFSIILRWRASTEAFYKLLKKVNSSLANAYNICHVVLEMEDYIRTKFITL